MGLPAFGAITTLAMIAWGAGNTHPTEEIHLLPGSAWLASAQVGQVTLLDGSSGEVAAQVKVASPGDIVDVVQHGTTAYAVNRSTGTIRRVDGSTFEASQPETPILDARAGLTAFAGKEIVHALDLDRGILATYNGKTLPTRGPPLSLGANLTAGGATVDSAGTLWVIDNTTGDLTWVTDGQRATRRGASQPGRGLITLAADRPVLVDTGGRLVAPIDPGTGAALRVLAIDLRPEDIVHISGSLNESRLYVVGSRGVLVVCDLAANNCDHVVPLGAAGDFGAPVEIGHHVLVPDFRTGGVWIVDLTANSVRSSQPLMTPPARFQLLTRDGVVFYNDPDSERAGVVRLDGSVRPAAKYDPTNPDKGLRTSSPASVATRSTPTTPVAVPSTSAGRTTASRPTSSQTGQQSTSRPPPSLPPPPVLRITVSKSIAEVGEAITFQVGTTRGETPANAQWDFGDGNVGSGTTTTHQWTTARTHQVSVRATMTDRSEATASISITITDSSMVTLTISNLGQGFVTAGADISCPPQCTITVARGSQIALEAFPQSRSSLFDVWEGACTGANRQCALSMDGNKAATAVFKYTVNVENTNTAAGSLQLNGTPCLPHCSGTARHGARVTVQATPNPGFRFLRWDGPCPDLTAENCAIVVDNHVSARAHFEVSR
ncbi:PKD domain-containing protein [Lentzea sp. NPDC005914]|uniref:InlB B-repeat-containing protein n=1 Tax=Lentzea sp. NPDC005914 TaxID=3154572 RepID=UPI0033E9C076